jgi:hypothetical protein
MRTYLVLAGFFAIGCSGTDDDLVGRAPQSGWSGRSDNSGGSSTTPGDASTLDASAGGGQATAPDASHAPPPSDAFTGAPPYVAQTGSTTIQPAHTFDPNLNPAGRACVTCHSGFLVGGTVYRDSAGTIAAPQVEVRVRDANGNGASTYADAAGNFYLRKSSAPNVALPAFVGVRDHSATIVMSGSVSSGGCATAGCHVAGHQGPVHL